MSWSRLCITMVLSVLMISGPGGLGAQSGHFNDSLLTMVRRASASVPGELPQAIRVVLLNPFPRTLAQVVEGGGRDTVPAAYPVFQIRYSRGWIIVDAALDKEFVPNSLTFSDEDYKQIHLALRDAQRIVVTHEHHDHGHTPGSQVVYVKTAAGREVILVGDVAWHLSGITTLRQKPPGMSRALSEDRDAIAAQLQWLQAVSATIPVVVSHDVTQINELIRRGFLVSGFDLKAP